MIVRILGEGQYRLDEADYSSLNAIDDRVQVAADASDATGFAAALTELVNTVVRLGTPLDTDEFEGSDAIVPGHGTTLEDARELLSSEGLIPD